MAQSPAESAGPAEQARAARIAELLVRTGAVAFRTDPPFRLTSGAESPVYVDNRRLLGHVAERREIVEGLLALASEGAPPAAIAGTATAGVPWGAWMAEQLGLPFLYVRSQAKSWGQGRAVEGFAPPGARVLVLEDLAFSAGSLLAAAESLRAAGFGVQDALTIASYELPRAHARMHAAGLRHATLTTLDEALAAARRVAALDDRQVAVVESWLLQMRAQDDV